jgi:hypothetical protein
VADDPGEALLKLLETSWILRVKACPICCVLVLAEHLERHAEWHVSTMTAEQRQATAADLMERLERATAEADRG